MFISYLKHLGKDLYVFSLVVVLSVRVEPSPKDAHIFLPGRIIDTSCIQNLHGQSGFITRAFRTYSKQGTNVFIPGLLFFFRHVLMTLTSHPLLTFESA